MSFRIIRNDITRMNTEAIVNTACSSPVVGAGCELAIYTAAGYDRLLSYRRENIGFVAEGEVFITPGFDLDAKYIIHAVSPLYGENPEEAESRLRSCYAKSLSLAREKGIGSVAFPLISTGSFGYPKEEGMRIAVEEITRFLLGNQMDLTLVVFDEVSTSLGAGLFPGLREYIDRTYVKEKTVQEYKTAGCEPQGCEPAGRKPSVRKPSLFELRHHRLAEPMTAEPMMAPPMPSCPQPMMAPPMPSCPQAVMATHEDDDAIERLNLLLKERMQHRSDTFSEYFLYLIEQKGMKSSEVYNRAIVSKQYFSKIKTNKDFHPEKIKALCLCVGAMLSLDETKDLLARAGYALSPCDLTDIIFSFYIEKGHFDVIDIDISLEEYGLPCIIS